MRQNLEEILFNQPNLSDSMKIESPPLDMERLEIKKEIIKNKFYFPTELFSGSLILYLTLFLLNNIFPGVISREIPINYLAILVLICGVGIAVWPPIKEKELKKVTAININIAKYSFLLLLIIVAGGFWYFFAKYRIQDNQQKVVRLAPDKYQIVLVNRSEHTEYSEVYKKLLINNGYKNISIATADQIPETTSAATIMYEPEDSAAGEEVASLIKLSYADIQTSPLTDSNPRTIVIIIK